jgi:hypothetical protein
MFNVVSDVVSDSCDFYYRSLPKDTGAAVLRSGVLTFTVAVIRLSVSDNKSLVRPAVAGAVAATASLIHALTQPLFVHMFADDEVKFEREFIKSFFVFSCTYALLNNFSAFKADLVSLTLVFNTVPVHLIKAEFDLAPRLFDFIGANDVAKDVRELYDYVGLGIDKEANSAYYSWLPGPL